MSSDIESSEDSTSESSEEEEESSSEEESNTPSVKEQVVKSYLTPLVERKSFPLCFWYYCSLKEKNGDVDKSELELLQQKILAMIGDMFCIENKKIEMFMIRGSREKDRIRIICPDIYVNTSTIINARILVLSRLHYKADSSIIPEPMYKYKSILPTVLLERQYDIAKGKYEPRQTYSCLLNKNLKTEFIENKLREWALYDPKKSLTPLSEQYLSFLVEHGNIVDDDDYGFSYTEEHIKEDNIENELAKELADAQTFLQIPSAISEEIKKKLGSKIDRCEKIFKKYHPDTRIRSILLHKEKFYIIDFTKSKHLCQLCKTTHKGNRQYLVYSPDLQKAYYHCHDTDAQGKSIRWSIKDSPPGSKVIRPSEF